MCKSKYVLPVLLLLGAGTLLSARHHHNEGLHLAAEIVGLVRTAVTPAPVVVAPAPAPVVVAPAPAPVVVAPAPAPVVVAPAPAPVVVAPAPVVIPDYGYGWWKGVWVPRYNDWYWHHGCWVWGGRGPRPVPPRWAPDFRRRPMPPPPRVYHHPAPPPRVYHHPAPGRPHPGPAPRHHHNRRW